MNKKGIHTLHLHNLIYQSTLTSITSIITFGDHIKQSEPFFWKLRSERRVGALAPHGMSGKGQGQNLVPRFLI